MTEAMPLSGEVEPQGEAVVRPPTWSQLAQEAGLTPDQAVIPGSEPDIAPPGPILPPEQVDQQRRIHLYAGAIFAAIDPKADYLFAARLAPEGYQVDAMARWVGVHLMAGDDPKVIMSPKGDLVPPRDFWIYRVDISGDTVFDVIHPDTAATLVTAGAQLIAGVDLTVFHITAMAKALALFHMEGQS